jgi:hypothetical protein
MSARLRLFDLVNSRLPQIIGRCPDDVPAIAEYANSAQERLIFCEEANEQGWTGSFAEMIFSVSKKHPTITTPRGVGRLIAMDACNRPIPLNNQFYEYLEFGDGRMPRHERWQRPVEWWRRTMAYTRNNTALMEEISQPPQQVQIFWSPQDCVPNPQTGAIPRAFIGGLSGGRIVTSQDNNQTVQGEFITAAQPYSMSVNAFDFITGVQKDATQNQVQFFQSDPTWGMSDPILTMEPLELVSGYRRYYLNDLPNGCCPVVRPIYVDPPPATCGCPWQRDEHVQVSALAKLDFIPVVALTDYLLIQSKEAIIAECQSIRMGKMDDDASLQMAAQYHAEAIRILRGQSVSDDGKNNVAVNYAPFGRGNWRRTNLSMR